MALRKYETEWEARPAQPTTTSIGRTPFNGAVAASPARALQHMLHEHAGALAEPHVEIWSQRRSLALIVSSAAVLWMALIVATAEVVKVVA